MADKKYSDKQKRLLGILAASNVSLHSARSRRDAAIREAVRGAIPHDDIARLTDLSPVAIDAIYQNDTT